MCVMLWFAPQIDTGLLTDAVPVVSIQTCTSRYQNAFPLHVQVCEHLQRVGKVCGVWAVPIVGGISPIKQERLLKKLPEVSHPYYCTQGTAALMTLVQYSCKPLQHAYTLLPGLLVLIMLPGMKKCAMCGCLHQFP